MSKLVLVGLFALLAAFCLFSYLPLTETINAGIIAEPDNVALKFLVAIFPVGYLVIMLFFVVLAIYAAMLDD